ncbi:unnamed protein product, partial [Ectocarpus sp. 12 AP-2014]
TRFGAKINRISSSLPRPQRPGRALADIARGYSEFAGTEVGHTRTGKQRETPERFSKRSFSFFLSSYHRPEKVSTYFYCFLGFAKRNTNKKTNYGTKGHRKANRKLPERRRPPIIV